MKNRVIIVGAGLAGMVAAIAAHRHGAQVTLIDRGSVGLGTNSALSGGLFTGPTTLHSQENYIRDTLDTGRWINRKRMVRILAEKAQEGFDFLRSLGLPVVELPTAVAVRPPDPALIPGVAIVKKVANKVREMTDIRILRGLYVTDVIVEEGRARGVRGFDKAGRTVTLSADGVIIATGGAGALYGRNDNQRTIVGQGYLLAARAGLKLWDMEFVQCYPLVIADDHLPSMLVYPPYPHEAKLISSAGEDILARYAISDINDAIMKKRDQLSVILHEESRRGPVRMDLTAVPATMWNRYPLAVLGKLKSDVRQKPFAVSPAVHFCMGGIEVNDEAQTNLEGLYGCGEIVWGVHGANRRGGNALTECLVFGMIAGRASAHGAKTGYQRGTQAQSEGSHPWECARSQSPSVSFREFRRRLGEVAWHHAGIVRNEEGMKEGLRKLVQFEEDLETLPWANAAQRAAKEDLAGAVFTLKAILTAGIGRKESRGSFVRSDFPAEDTVNWLKNSCVAFNPGEESLSVTYHSVQ